MKENRIITKRTSETQYDFYGLDNKIFELNQFRDSEIILIHLATFFSKDNQYIKKIHYANIDFGKDVVNKLNEFNLNFSALFIDGFERVKKPIISKKFNIFELSKFK